MLKDEQARTAVIKQVRRSILDALNLTRPARLEYATICGVFVDTDEHYIRRDLDYLVLKGYVRWVNQTPNAPWRGRLFELTSSGVEIADKINVDPALEP